MRLVYAHESQDPKEFSTEATNVVIGRKGADVEVDMDMAVSRKHAALTFENGQFFVEDLNSRNGTFVNDKKITSKTPVTENDVIRVGKTRVMLQIDEALIEEMERAKAEEGKKKQAEAARQEQEKRRAEEEKGKQAELARQSELERAKAEEEKKRQAEAAPPAEKEKEIEIHGVEAEKEPMGEVRVTSCFNVKDLPFLMGKTKAKEEGARDVVIATAGDVATAAERRLALYYETAMALGEEGKFEARLQKVVERALEGIPFAKRSALLLKERKTQRLLLVAHAPRGSTPAVSQTLAKQAISQRQAFNWSEEAKGQKSPAMRSDSLVMHSLRSGIYAPLVWKEDVFGVLCMDSGSQLAAFDDQDLRLMIAIANHIAMCAANYYLQEQLQNEASMKSNLMRQFSPKVVDKLMEGRIGAGDRMESTILCSDIRGFTEMSAGMHPKEVVEMLNDYFGELTPLVFKYDGTVDKYIGDSILAVFGSPEPDNDQCEKAVRAALEMQDKVKELNVDREKRKRPMCRLGIGVHCGEVLHGFIGSPERMEFTVIGDAVNRASRFCDGAGPGEVLISSDLYQRVYWLVDGKEKRIKTKHADEGELEGYSVVLKKGK
ncbi:MAG: FHA domain-containing protein [Deltaproteobacteria bacterium]|nr:FHA domain-containing protein [Deltaproteobacteria bacterium]